MKSRASLLVWASGCLAGQTNEHAQIRHEVVELLRVLDRVRLLDGDGRQLHGTRVRAATAADACGGGGLFHGVFAEHEHAVVLADDRIVHVDLGVAHHGASQHHLVRLLRQPGEFHDLAQARADDDVRVARAGDGVA